MSKGSVLDPTASRSDDNASPGPDAGLLAGKRVGFRLDRMWRAWDWISEQWAEHFRAAGADTVLLTSPYRWMLVQELHGGEEPDLDGHLRRLPFFLLG